MLEGQISHEKFSEAFLDRNVSAVHDVAHIKSFRKCIALYYEKETIDVTVMFDNEGQRDDSCEIPTASCGKA